MIGYTGENVRKIRNDLDIPIKTFLSELGINQSTFCKKERGQLKFNLVEAYKIAKLFQKTIEDIFFNNEYPK